MSEDVKPKQFYINEDKLKENSGIDYVATEIETRRFSGIAVIELEPTMRLMDELAEKLLEAQSTEQEMIFEANGCPGFDGHMVIQTKYDEALKKYKKFKEALK